jgi:pheromone shutdown protein TraB
MLSQARLLPADMHLMNTRTLQHRDGGVVHVVGVAHMSKASVQEVKTVIRTVKPDVVTVELCAQRADMLNATGAALYPVIGNFSDQSMWTLIDPFFWLYHLPMYAVQALTGVRNGEEQMAAANEAANLNANCLLVDRQVSVTLARCLDSAFAFAFSRQFPEFVVTYVPGMVWDTVTSLIGMGKESTEFGKQYHELHRLVLGSEQMNDEELTSAKDLTRELIDKAVGDVELLEESMDMMSDTLMAIINEPLLHERDRILGMHLCLLCSVHRCACCVLCIAMPVVFCASLCLLCSVHRYACCVLCIAMPVVFCASLCLLCSVHRCACCVLLCHSPAPLHRPPVQVTGFGTAVMAKQQ